MAIRVLPDNIANQIAAGEVVERPVSVVRELVDNAIDAGAKEIRIALEMGGRSVIRVNDNGCGMNKDDALLSFERHATSKISKSDDLLGISTLGFRGEALPSIASVSEVLLRTRNAGASIGSEIHMVGGTLKSVGPCACNIGTEICVEKLFYNVPARKKFLREAGTELGKVKQLILRMALAYPKVHFRLSNDSKEILNLPRRKNILERAELVVRGNTLEYSLKADSMSVVGVVAHPAQAEADANAFIILINGRVVTDRMILRAVRDGFDSMLKDREFPLGFLSLTIDARSVDVNVHPQKSEVRFVNSQEVFRFVRDAISQAVNKFKAPVASQLMIRPKAEPKISPLLQSNVDLFRSTPRVASNAAIESVAIASSLSLAMVEPQPVKEFRYVDLQYIGQLFACYLLCVYNEDFIVVDMHAAHERCNYNVFRKYAELKSQEFLIPLSISLSEVSLQKCMQFKDELSANGFVIEEFGEKQFSVRAAPHGFLAQDISDMLKELGALQDEVSSEGVLKERIDKIIARKACHASIRSGRLLEREEVRALFESLDKTELSSACPHGRPVIVQFTKAQVETWFGRDR